MRAPRPADAPDIWRLARDSGGLDLNSPYAYLLAGLHFAETSVVAETSGELAGFVYAYRPPTEPDSVFVWQVTVAARHRGAGLAHRLVREVVDRARTVGARRLTASVTPSNEASRRLFASVAADLGAPFEELPWISADEFPTELGDHEPENLVVVGPFDSAASAGPSTSPARAPDLRTASNPREGNP